ncbi:MAG: hydroxyethylthiazole kinase [Thermocladium sp.]|jgi:hydroxyethylthiazole kinase|nr:MAG: hydroxyethylthiazole kinase [Thermocladium sp. ECH_B]
MNTINYWEDLEKIRKQRPLIHHLMNFVVMNDAANITLAIGASPIMAHAVEEVEELVAAAGALYINIGTLDKQWIESMLKAGKAANRNGVPVLLDPVGAGASRLRTETAKQLLREVEISILKGNGGEVMALAGESGKIKGVDSLGGASIDAVDKVAREFGVTVVATGPVDYVSDARRRGEVRNGTPMLQLVTGSGCMLGSVMSSFLAVNRDPFTAAIEGLVAFEVAAESAVEGAMGPASFRNKLIDEVYRLNKKSFEKAKVTILT